ncbi:uncharacterized protein [Periplaneta americana]|uniref:uncharacterized protein isoform X8 n=1 Tax=Periplaneta americana TaxID=6978 RepID=UPI0037E83A4B
MPKFTNTEYLDMLLIYGETRCNSRAAQRLYAERYRKRIVPTPETFIAVSQRVRDTGSVTPGRRDRVLKRRHNTRGRMSSKKQRADTESDTSSETSKMTVSNSSEEAAIGDPICKTEVTVSNSSEDAPFCAAVCKTEMTVSNSSEDAPFCASVCKTEVHILDDVTIKTELTDETYAESQNCILGDLVPKQETPKCE